MRKYNDSDRAKATEVRDRNITSGPAPDYPAHRQPGEIIKRVNGQELTVKLYPWGKCTQWLAIFPDGKSVKGGMNKIDAEIRLRMPPLRGYY